MDSPISLSPYTGLRRRQVRNALRDVHPVPDSQQGRELQGPSTSNAKAERRKPGYNVATPNADFGEDASHLNREHSLRSNPMQYVNYQSVPVFSTDPQPLMPCHPARARKMLAKSRAVPHHVCGIFGIRLLDRTREESEVQDVALNIDPGSDTSGFTVVADDEEGQRTILFAVELKHHAFATKATLTRRRAFRRNRRGRLRYRAPRFDNRTKPKGWLTPSVQSLVDDTMRLVNTLRQMFPISNIRIERNKFDPHLMMNPEISGFEYQHGTLQGRQIRAYVLDRDNSRCVYCRNRHARLELDHVRPRATCSNRVDNFVAACRPCNLKKANRPIEQFLQAQAQLMKHILDRLQRSDLERVDK